MIGCTQADEAEMLDKANEPRLLHVCITGANSPVCYSMLSSLANGYIFGPDVIINVLLYDRYQICMQCKE